MTAVAMVVVAVVGLLATVAWFQERMIFFPERLEQEVDLSWTGAREEVFLEADDGARIHGLVFEAKGERRGVVLYFHGNAGSVASWYAVAEELSRYGVDVLLIDYRTYGKSRGAMSEEGLYHDGKAAYAYLVEEGYDPAKIIVHGRSLGAAIATDVASQHPVGGVVLETPFTSLKDRAREIYPFLLPGLLLRYEMDNLERVASLDAPTWVVHGTDDRVIPVEHGREVFQAARKGWEMTVIEGGGHNNLMSFSGYDQGLSRFYEDVLGPL